MNWLFVVAVVVVVGCLGFLVYMAITAPEGYEDKEGFHYGKKIT